MLTAKQSKFVASYQLSNNPTQSAINAGYSAKSAPVEGNRLLKNPKILAELEQWRAKKAQDLSKADFVDLAIGDYKNLELTEPNKPRFLDIAGKALGYIGSSGDNRPQTINNLTQINISGSESQKELWEMTRKLLGNG